MSNDYKKAAIDAEGRLIDLTEGLLEISEDMEVWFDCPSEDEDEDCNCPKCGLKRLVAKANEPHQ